MFALVGISEHCIPTLQASVHGNYGSFIERSCDFKVRIGGQKHSNCRATIPPGPTYLLIESVKRFWYARMHNCSHMGIVDTEAKCRCGYNQIKRATRPVS